LLLHMGQIETWYSIIFHRSGVGFIHQTSPQNLFPLSMHIIVVILILTPVLRGRHVDIVEKGRFRPLLSRSRHIGACCVAVREGDIEVTPVSVVAGYPRRIKVERSGNNVCTIAYAGKAHGFHSVGRTSPGEGIASDAFV
jgi:hypothetical protein